jgi:hypothetical protein
MPRGTGDPAEQLIEGVRNAAQAITDLLSSEVHWALPPDEQEAQTHDQFLKSLIS